MENTIDKIETSLYEVVKVQNQDNVFFTNILLLEGFHTYLIKRNMSQNTIIAYFVRLKKFYEVIGNKHFFDVTYEDVDRYMDVYSTNADQTKSQARCAVKEFYKWLIKYDLITFDPTKRIEPIRRKNKKLPVYLTPEEIHRMYDTFDTSNIKGLRDKALLAFMFSTGCRISEVVEAKTSDIQEYKDNLHVINILGKGKKERVVPISPFAYNLMQEYWSHLDFKPTYLFCTTGRSGGRHKDGSYCNEIRSKDNKLTRTMCLLLIKEAGKNAGIEKTISPHKIRHSFATDLVNNGCDIYTISELLGHSEVNTTKIYAHLNVNNKIENCMKYHTDYQE